MESGASCPHNHIIYDFTYQLIQLIIANIYEKLFPIFPANCYNIEQQMVTHCDRNEEVKRSFLSKRRPISPSRIKLKFLARQESVQLQQRHRLQPASERRFPTTNGQAPPPLPPPRLSNAKSLEWDCSKDLEDAAARRNGALDSPALVKSKSIDYLTDLQQQQQPRIGVVDRSGPQQRPFTNSNNNIYISNINNNYNQYGNCDPNANRSRVYGSSITINSLNVDNIMHLTKGSGGGGSGGGAFEDNDSGILVNESGQCSMISDITTVAVAAAAPINMGGTTNTTSTTVNDGHCRTVYLRKTMPNSKGYGLLISQMRDEFETPTSGGTDECNRFRVRHILKGSEAEICGQIRCGDEIISINDVPVRELSFGQMQDVINAKPVLRLVLVRPYETLPSIR